MTRNDIISREMAIGAVVGCLGRESIASRVIGMLPALESAEVLSSQWISVKDELPNPGENVIVYAPRYSPRDIRHAEYTINRRWSGVRGEHVTHWMHRPLPPEDGK